VRLDRTHAEFVAREHLAQRVEHGLVHGARNAHFAVVGDAEREFVRRAAERLREHDAHIGRLLPVAHELVARRYERVLGEAVRQHDHAVATLVREIRQGRIEGAQCRPPALFAGVGNGDVERATLHDAPPAAQEERDPMRRQRYAQLVTRQK